MLVTYKALDLLFNNQLTFNGQPVGRNGNIFFNQSIDSQLTDPLTSQLALHLWALLIDTASTSHYDEIANMEVILEFFSPSKPASSVNTLTFWLNNPKNTRISRLLYSCTFFWDHLFSLLTFRR